MIYIKHPEHGYLAVPQVEEVHRRGGWEVCDIYEEIQKKGHPEETAQEPAEEEPPGLDEYPTLEAMSKEQLDQFARETYGVELDRRKSKDKMLKDLFAKIEA